MRWCPECRKVRSDTEGSCPTCNAVLETLTETFFLGWRPAERYRIVRLIGRGGAGAVFEGEHVRLKRRVAIKVLMSLDPLRGDSERQMYREARIVARLKHPNIVDVIDFDVSDEGIPFMVMEYLEGRGLDRFLREEGGALPAERFFLFADQICAGLMAAHQAGVVHRDLKPGNIIVRARDQGDWEVKILDFGISKITAATGSYALTRQGGIIGTPRYMAPEQIRGEPVDVRTDIYALGVMLFEMWAGEPPFTGESMIELLEKHLHAPPQELHALRPGTPGLLSAAVARALAKDPEERWPTVAALRAELQQARRDLERGEGLPGEDDIPTICTPSAAARRQDGSEPSWSAISRERSRSIELEPAALDSATAPATATAGQAQPRVAEAGALHRRRLGLVILAVVGLGALLWGLGRLVGPGTEGDMRAGAPSPAESAAAGALTATPLPEGKSPPWRAVQRSIPAGMQDAIALITLLGRGEALIVHPLALVRWAPGSTLSTAYPLAERLSLQVDSPLGDWFLGEAKDRLLGLDLEDLRIARTIELPEPALDAAALDAEGRLWLLLLPERSRALRYDAESGTVLADLALGGGYYRARISPDRRSVALLSSREVSIRDAETLKLLFQIPLSKPMLRNGRLAWSPSGRRLAFGFKHLFVYDVAERRALAALPTA